MPMLFVGEKKFEQVNPFGNSGDIVRWLEIQISMEDWTFPC